MCVRVKVRARASAKPALALAGLSRYQSGRVIGQDTIERVRAQTSIVKLIAESVKLERRGRNHVGLCPFHKEKTGSFHVMEERGFFHCFGCQKSGDVITFCRESMGLSFVEAVRHLAERAGIVISEIEQDDPALRESRRTQKELFDVNLAAAKFFRRELLNHPLAHYAREELKRRSLSLDGPDAVQAALESFHIGYAPYGWDSLAAHLRKIGFNLSSAEAVGLLLARREGGGFLDRFRHRLMFAVLDLQGRVVGFSGRCLEDPTHDEVQRLGLSMLRSEGTPAKYMNSPESPIYRKREVVFGLYQARQGIRRTGQAVIVEGNFDVMALHARGMDNVVAPLGTAFTVEQAQQVRRFTNSLVLLFDGDEAGKRAVVSAKGSADEVGFDIRVAELPVNTDPDEFSRVHGAAALKRVIDSSRGLLEYLIDRTLDSDFSRHDARARARKIREVIELLRAEKDPTVRSLAEKHADQIAERLGVGDARTFRALARAVREGLSQPAGRNAGEPAAPPSTARSPDQRRRVELEILGAFLDYPELLSTPEIEEGLKFLVGDVAVAIAAMRHHNPDEGWTSLEHWLAESPPSIHPFARDRLASPRHCRPEDARRELASNMNKLMRLEMARQSTETAVEAERAKKSGDFEQELLLVKEQMERARARISMTER